MKLEKVLEKLEELLRKWGLNFNDWVLTSECAWKLQDYKLKQRKGHIDIYVDRNKWPWKTEPMDISCFPLPCSKEFFQLKEFMEKTKFSPHFLPVPIKLKYNPIGELRRDSKIYILSNGRKIRIHDVYKDFEIRAKTLLGDDISTWKRETLERWLKNFLKIKRITKRENDKAMLRICEKAIERCRIVRKKIKPEKIEEISKELNQIKGQTAFKGNARGRARIIFYPQELSKLKKREILITSMTTPEFILGIERASAIVTDEGGIGCHAAIISREFKIPCIIGTKFATKILKDGDLVEVDAGKGIVRKLK